MAWLVSLGAIAAAAAACGAHRWSRRTRALQAGLEAGRLPPDTARYNLEELEGLPPPVQRFFRAVLTDGQPIVSAVSLEQVGSINMGKSTPQWKPFTARQRIVTRRPGFDWEARILMLPGVPVRIHDAYVAGEGTLQAALFGLVTVAHLPPSAELARGELMRFLAEAAWYPTALLPSQGVRWEPIDDHTALATLTDGPMSLTLTFRFLPDGPIDTVRAEARGRLVGGILTSAPWQGRFWNYATRSGMRVPLQGEVAWDLPQGLAPYWRGTVTALTCEVSR